ncbi:MAG: DUF3727 domain-containing protein [Cyanobacteria bacterium P01_F01_bin.153]
MTWDVPTITITDPAGRQLNCYIEHALEVEGQDYLLLHPIDSPVEIVTWEQDDDDTPTVVESEETIKVLFPTAKAVLAEENLSLKESAVTLTVAGDLPELSEDDDDEVDDDGEELEAFQWLASFFHNDQEYAVYTPLDPFFILARRGADGEPELLSPAEFERIESILPSLEDHFFEGL